MEAAVRPSADLGAARRWPLVVVTVLLAMVVGVGGVWADAFGVRERVGHLVARVDLVLNPPARPHDAADHPGHAATR